MFIDAIDRRGMINLAHVQDINLVDVHQEAVDSGWGDEIDPSIPECRVVLVMPRSHPHAAFTERLVYQGDLDRGHQVYFAIRDEMRRAKQLIEVPGWQA